MSLLQLFNGIGRLFFGHGHGVGRGLSFKRHKDLALDRIKHDQLRLAADRLCFFDRRRGSQHVMPVDALYIPAECLPLGLVRSDRLDIGDKPSTCPLL